LYWHDQKKENTRMRTQQLGSDDIAKAFSLSKEAMNGLRTALNDSYGEQFEANLSDGEVNSIGELMLTVLAEDLKLRVATPALPANRS
jgi:hypothetical protein